MDQKKIGKFIADCRRGQNLTQMQLAEKLNITDRAVSKWETGKSMPDVAIMLELCQILHITVNDLLSGEVVSMEDYNKKMEENLLDAIEQKQRVDKHMLSLEIVLMAISLAGSLALFMLAAFLTMPVWLRFVLMGLGLVIVCAAAAYGVRIEQIAGYYCCGQCGHRYVPTYSQVLWAVHSGRTRYMRCPKCGQKSWQKKVLSKE